MSTSRSCAQTAGVLANSRNLCANVLRDAFPGSGHARGERRRTLECQLHMIGPDSLQQNGTITFDGETEHMLGFSTVGQRHFTSSPEKFAEQVKQKRIEFWTPKQE